MIIEMPNTRTREISQKIDELHVSAASRRPAAC